MNPIERIWVEAERRLMPYSSKNKDKLWSIIQQEWKSISPKVTSKLVNSQPKRLQEILKSNGGPTRY